MVMATAVSVNVSIALVVTVTSGDFIETCAEMSMNAGLGFCSRLPLKDLQCCRRSDSRVRMCTLPSIPNWWITRQFSTISSSSYPFARLVVFA